MELSDISDLVLESEVNSPSTPEVSFLLNLLLLTETLYFVLGAKPLEDF